MGANKVARESGGDCEREKNQMLAARDGFQVGQTAKARRGPPCAVTPGKDVAANSDGIVSSRPEREHPLLPVEPMSK
jgi:hypothetical protein